MRTDTRMSGGFHPVTNEAVVEAIAEITPWIIALLLVPLTHLGSVLVIVPALGVAYLWRPRTVAPWLGAVAGYYGVMAGIKSLNSATRPDVAPPIGPEAYPELFSWWYTHATSISTTSFPSGNVMLATIIAGLITLDLKAGSLRQRAMVTGTLVFAVAYSRIALGVHYPIDVIAGVALGVGFLAVFVLVRDSSRDPVASVFALGAICALFAIWVSNGTFSAPPVESLTGSNRPIAFGGALGGLVGWKLTQRYAGRLRRQTAAVVTVTLVLIAVGAYLGHSEPSTPLLTTVRAGILTVAIVSLPWFFPNRVRSDEPAPSPTAAD